MSQQHEHTDCGHTWPDNDTILETKLISQNLELTYSPCEKEREKAKNFMDHFLKRKDAVRVLLQVIVLNKDFSKNSLLIFSL